jgi:membrane associated rhomboid family serine protease
VPYLALYLITGIIATFGHALFHWNDAVPVLGASGAIAGVMGAYLVFRPRGRILTVLLWNVVYVPAWVLLGLFFVTQFIAGDDSVAWVAHAAGMGAGFLAALVLARIFPDPNRPVTRPTPPVRAFSLRS